MNCILKLCPDYGEEFLLEQSSLNEVKIENKVYSDMSYTANIEFDERIQSLKFYINNIPRECFFDNEKIKFNDENCLDNKIFINLFGLAKVKVEITTKNDNYLFEFDYVDVAIKKGIQSKSIIDMMKYINSYSEEFLQSQTTNTIALADIKKSYRRNLKTQLEILEMIIKEYTNSFKYFKVNSKFKFIESNKIDDFEKLKKISSSTIKYIVSNLQELYEVSINTGIKYNNRNFMPRKTLIGRNLQCYDIRENQIVVGFLKSLYVEINNKIKNLKNSKLITSTIKLENQYIFFDDVIKEYIGEFGLKDYCDKLENINKKIQTLYISYSKAISSSEIPVNRVPKPSKTFTSIYHYKKIYSVIIKWFDFGNYNFDKEKMILSFFNSSQIYEYYILLKLNNFYLSNNFSKKKIRKFEYDYLPTKFKQTEWENTFEFEKENEKITVYYQPVIYSKYQENAIGLFKNNSMRAPLSSDRKLIISEQEGKYLTPDYIIKHNICGKVSYSILDAKFSTFMTFKKYYFMDILFKYLFSISTNVECKINGVFILCGKPCEENKDAIYNMYDNDKFKDEVDIINPAFKVLNMYPLEGEHEEEHMKMISEILLI